MKLQRETATHEEDLPHQYASVSTKPCDVCGAGEKDPRHVSWERERLASRERASMTLQTEKGS